jgi:hypothetical protein
VFESACVVFEAHNVGQERIKGSMQSSLFGYEVVAKGILSPSKQLSNKGLHVVIVDRFLLDQLNNI